MPKGFDELDGFARTLEEARAGAVDDLGRLLMSCRDYLLLVARRELGGDLRGKIDPSDLVQETFLEAQRDFACFRGASPEELLAWLVRIQRNNVANVTRAYRDARMRAIDREVAMPAGGADAGLCRDTPTPSERVIAEEESAALARGMARLSERYQQVLRLRYQEGMTFGQIGAALGCSAEAARKLWARAVDHLQRELPPP